MNDATAFTWTSALLSNVGNVRKVSRRTTATAACTQMATPGVRYAALTRSTPRKNKPSRAMA